METALLKKRKISVIIPTYNSSKLLSFSLESLINQKINKNDFEVIVCDDGSADDTVALLEKYVKKINLKYTFQKDEGYRPGSARNNGIRISEAEICLFIDAGVMLSSNCLTEHINFYSDKNYFKSALGYVYGLYHIENFDDELKSLINTDDVDASINRLQQNSTYHDIREYSYEKYRDRIENLPAPWFYFWTCHLSVGTQSLNKVGLFDEKYDGNWGSEDNDLGLRLSKDGIKISLLRQAKSIHYPHDECKIHRKIKGLTNSRYFDEKFKTHETGLFYNMFKSESSAYTDLNELILKDIVLEN